MTQGVCQDYNLKLTDPITKLIALAITSKYVKIYPEEQDLLSTYGINLVLIAKPESGKTYNLFKFKDNKGVEIIQDINYNSLLDILSQIASGSLRVYTILVPDFWKVLSKRKDTVSNLLTLLNIVVEEGVCHLRGGYKYIVLQKPIRLNFILATTPAEFFYRRNIIGLTGFISRFLPISYSLSHEKTYKIRKIVSGEITQNHEEKVILNLPNFPVEINISTNFRNDLEALALEVHSKIVSQLRLREEESGYGFRLIRSFIKMACANALLNDRNSVEYEDIEEICRLANYIGFEFKSV